MEEPMLNDRERHPRDAAEPNAAAGGAGAPPDPAEPNRAPPVMREYSTDRITVEWRAERCIHSANCIRALPKVFDPRRRPWVDVEVASTDDIAQAVLRCPTGALQFVRHDDGAQESPDTPTSLTPIRNGPLYVRGALEVRDLDGHMIRTGTRVSLCRCGLAQQIPFCDNTCRKEHWREPSSAVPRAGPTGGPESAPPSAD
jgi:uncharacterized Fe-S cluster protein YjdI/CDGSH-type Zn-finger protein